MTINQIAMGGSIEKPHFVLVSLFAQGHMIPTIDFARLLALRGVLVTVVSTPANSARFKALVDRANAAASPLIRLAELRFPCAEVGLPEGCENMDLLQSLEFSSKFFLALSMLREPLLLHLREQRPRPSCLVCDLCVPWTRDVARELGVPRFVFYWQSCIYHLGSCNASKVKPADLFEPFLVPDFPHELEVVKAQALQMFDFPGWEKMHSDLLEAEETADGVVINTFQELEAPYLDSYSKVLKKKFWAVGPVCLANKDAGDMASRGNKMSADEKYILSWLDARNPNSVIYVSFGTVAINSSSHLLEVGIGLEASNQSFIWVIKQVELTPAVKQWLEEFEERTRARGLIIKGWAPQMLILVHPSVGGFMTHSGWNSTLEGVAAGLPMVTWPHVADQFLNEKLVVEVLKTGVALKPKMRTMYITQECEGLITREDVETAVRKVMDGGEEGEDMKKRAEEMREKAKNAMEEEGSSYQSLTLFIQQVLELANSKDSGDLLPSLPVERCT